ncbi:hypothetical protein HN011_001756, partial [Eciton burchellii]
SPEGRWSPKEELLKSISSPLGDGAPFPRACHDPFCHRKRGDKDGTFIPIEEPAEQSRRVVLACSGLPKSCVPRCPILAPILRTTPSRCLQLPTAYPHVPLTPDYSDHMA